MRITLFAIGSRGDAQPYVALGTGLAAAGHDVAVATHRPFRSLVEEHGLRFRPIEGDPQQAVQGEAAQAWLESGDNPVAFARRMVPLIREFFDAATVDFRAASEDTDAVVYSALGFPGYHLAERLGLPSAAAYLQPVHRTRAFPSATVNPPRPLPGPLNWLTHVAGEQGFWQPFRAPVNRWRRKELGLDPVPLTGPFGRLRRERHPVLYGYSPSVVPRPADWAPWLHVTGYWFLDAGPGWEVPSGLEDFLAAGPPPVYIGFGSMRPRDSAALSRTVFGAIARSGRRAVLHPGWAGLDAERAPEGVLVVRDVPHAWLFPRMAAVVHHGGAGTTAAGVRAGVPSVVCPFFADQFLWGERVARLGVGPRPLPQRELDAATLAAALVTATTDRGMGERAAALGERVRSEDGIGRAVAVLERHLAGTVGRRRLATV